MQVDSDLQSLEDILCETLDTEITMETAQSMLDQYQPLASGLKENYPAMKELGTFKFMCTTISTLHCMTLQLHTYTYVCVTMVHVHTM